MFFKMNLKEHRKIKGLTQKELSQKSKLAQQYISELEDNDRAKSPTLDTVAKLANALKICPYSLIGFNCIKTCIKHENCACEYY